MHDMTGAFVTVNITYKEFAAPDRAVISVSRSVHTDAEYLPVCDVVFCQTGKDMGIVMLNLNEREPFFGSDFFRSIDRIV